MAPHIRTLRTEDYDAVTEIDRHSFINAWQKERFKEVAEKKNRLILVAQVGELVVGYALYQLHLETIEIVRMAVHPAFRKQGIGHALMTKLKSRLNDKETKRRQTVRNKLMVLISERNDSAHLWLKEQQFLATEVTAIDGETMYQFEYWYDFEDLEAARNRTAEV